MRCVWFDLIPSEFGSGDRYNHMAPETWALQVGLLQSLLKSIRFFLRISMEFGLGDASQELHDIARI